MNGQEPKERKGKCVDCRHFVDKMPSSKKDINFCVKHVAYPIEPDSFSRSCFDGGEI